MWVHMVFLIALSLLCSSVKCQLEFESAQINLSLECLDTEKLIRDSGETWFVAATCQNCMCNNGEITCNAAKGTCPEAPHPSCVEIPGGCCPTWDCSDHLCMSRKLGEVWSDEKEPCRRLKCTEEGIRRTVTKCPPLEQSYMENCSLQSDGECCLRWHCMNCPDSKSFGRSCIHYKDQCQNNTQCEYGEICCLVDGCGKECLTPCVDSEGTSHAIGQTWNDPQIPRLKWICREDGMEIFVENSESQDDEEDLEEVLHQEGEPLLPAALQTLNSLRDNWPVKDVDFYIRNFGSSLAGTRIGGSPEITGTVFQSPSSLISAEVQAFVNAFNWTALVPLLSRDFTSETRTALDAGDSSLQLRIKVTRMMVARDDSLPPDSPSMKHQVAFRRTDPISTRMANLGHIIGRATKNIVTSFDIPRIATSGLALLGESSDCRDRFSAFQRPELATCDRDGPYRTLDGSCNNPTNRLLGAAFTKFRRSLPPDYGDGISTLRQSTNGTPLPSARLVSSRINNRPNVDSNSLTIFHMTFGQFLDHDLTATPIGKSYIGGAIKCCDDFRDALSATLNKLNTTKTAIRNVRLMDQTSGSDNVLESEAVKELMHDLEVTEDALLHSLQDAKVSSPLLMTLQSDSPLLQRNLFRRPVDEECAPISIPFDDPFYSPHGQTCMEFVRSAPAARCTFGPREQLNQHSAYLDGSVIYGVKRETTNSLRTFQNGLLKAQVTSEGQRLLPPSLNPNDGCNIEEKFNEESYCFRSGDGRVNEQILLTLFQTVWKREHNRIANILKNFNPTWRDEKLFQETRRIVGAELQHVVFKEFLPTVLGPFVMNLLNLNPLNGDEQTTDYDKDLDPSISNVFATAAYRFGHSEVQDFLLKIKSGGLSSMEILSSLFFHPFSLYERNTLGDFARGGTAQPAAKVDTYFSEEVAGNLFKGSQPFGLDLVAFNIQRGRDHGIPGYTKWREHCGLTVVNAFRDLHSDMDSQVVEALQRVYRNVHDIDLFIGGVAERPSLGGIIGPTFTCIIADQFLRIKQGDRYWYEYKDSPGAFSKAQLSQLHKVSFARILCNNLPELQSIQPQPLRNLGSQNHKVRCSSSIIPRYNLNPWRRRPISFPGDFVSNPYD